MQTIWKGAVSFGLVSIPVRLYAATEERDVSFRQVHAEDGGRIRYKRVCEKDGEEVAYRDIAKGYELPDGQMITLTSEDFASLPLPSRKTIDVLQFVPAEQIDPVYFARTYYLQADGPGAKPYVLLRDALERVGRVAVVKVALRNREALATLRPKDGVLVMQTMLWPDEVRDASFAEPGDDVEVRPQEVAMAESYIDTLSEDFQPEAFTDDYRAALEELVAAKAGGAELAEPEEPQRDTGTVVDLMAALKASVDAARSRREGAAAGEGGADEPSAGSRRGGAAKKGSARSGGQASGAARSSRAAKSAGASADDSARESAGAAAAERKKAAPRKAAAKKTAPAKKTTASAAAERTAAKKAAGAEDKAPAKTSSRRKSA